MPFTLQTTAVSDVLETVALKFSVSPSNTVPAWGATPIVMEGGGGGGGATEPAPPPPQPRVHAPAARRTQVSAVAPRADNSFLISRFASRSCGRGRIPFLLQTKAHTPTPIHSPPLRRLPAHAFALTEKDSIPCRPLRLSSALPIAFRRLSQTQPSSFVLTFSHSADSTLGMHVV